MKKIDYLLSQEETLKRLYLDEHKTTREIGEFFGVSKHPIETALRYLNIKRRHTRTKGFKPTKETLERLILIEHRSYDELAMMFNCDKTAIPYWLKEYGIYQPKDSWTSRNAKRHIAEPTKQEFEALYIDQELSLDQIGKLHGATRVWAESRIRAFGIPIRPGGWKHKVFVAKDGHRVKSTYEKRVDDWLYEHGVLHEYEPLAPFNHKCHADFRVGDTYIEIWGVTDNEIYKERQAYKIEQYEILGINLISINHWDFASHRNELWKRKLRVFLR